VITTAIKPKALLPTKPESNETTLWFAATKSDEEWKNATFAHEEKHDWEAEDMILVGNETQEERNHRVTLIDLAIIEAWEKNETTTHRPATTETTIVIKKEEYFVDIDAPKEATIEKEVDTDSDDDDDDDDNDDDDDKSIII